MKSLVNIVICLYLYVFMYNRTFIYLLQKNCCAVSSSYRHPGIKSHTRILFPSLSSVISQLTNHFFCHFYSLSLNVFVRNITISYHAFLVVRLNIESLTKNKNRRINMVLSDFTHHVLRFSPLILLFFNVHTNIILLFYWLWK